MTKISINPFKFWARAYEILAPQYGLMIFFGVAAYFISSSIPFGILMGPTFCGLTLVVMKRKDGESISIADFFNGFEYFTKTITFGLVTALLVMISLIVMAFLLIWPVLRSNPENTVMVFPIMFLAFAVSHQFLLFGLMLCVIHIKHQTDLSTSIDLAIAMFEDHLAVLLGLFVVNTVVGMLCFMMLIIPFFLILPILVGSLVLAFDQILDEMPIEWLEEPAL